jgi:hypothetical protein
MGMRLGRAADKVNITIRHSAEQQRGLLFSAIGDPRIF